MAPEDLLSVCCLVLQLVLPALVLSPLVSSCPFPCGLAPWGSRAPPGPFLGLLWALLGPLLGFVRGPFWASSRPSALQGLSWASPGPLLTPPGAPWAPSWAALGGSWASLGPLGPLLAAFGPLLGRPGPKLRFSRVLASGSHFGPPGGPWGAWGPPGPPLALSWVGPGALLAALGSLLGRSWRLLGPSWRVLGRSWRLLGRSWGSLGPAGGLRRAILGALFGPSCASSCFSENRAPV